MLHFLSDGIPDLVILDAMFLITFQQTMNINNYAKLLLNRFALVHYKAGVKEVHMLFDAPMQLFFNPKVFEQMRRDITLVMTTIMSTLHFNHIL